MKFAVLFFLLVFVTTAWGATITGSGVTVTVSSNGDYSVAKDSPAFTYSGSLSQSLGSLQETPGGTDGIGPYRELTFTYDSGNYAGSVKVYTNGRPVCLFTTTCLGAQTDLGSYFPHFTSQPTSLYHHGYSGKWCVEQWTRDGIATDSPRIYFDDDKGTAIISAAANYMDAYLEDDDGGIKSGLQSWATGLPDGYTHRTIVVIDNGILSTFDEWGTALCDLQGKTSPDNDADIGLKYIGYWNDNGATYYYDSSFGGYSDYDELLNAVKDRYDDLEIRLGYMQLDSWWYIKDPSNPWNKIGCYLYEPVPSFFPYGLADFQSRLGVPLITHNRWIGGSVSGDVWSPYRDEYDFSNGVSIDPNFWDEIIGNIASWGVKTYEQDWLDNNAKPSNIQGHGELFMNYMAERCAANNVTMQYCMAVPRHYMQATKYDHVTTLRCLQDRFNESKWKDLLWKTPFIHAIGSWPWVDVFRSNEDGNFVLCVLSAGMVGMADAIGSEDTVNILKAVRRDGVVVKPDIPVRPSDKTFLRKAASGSGSITGYTYSETDGKRIVYVFDLNPLGGDLEDVTNESNYSARSNNWNTTSGSGYQLIYDGDETFGNDAQTVVAGEEAWVEFDLGTTKTISSARVHEDNEGNYQLYQWKVRYYDGTWHDAFAYTDSTNYGWNDMSFSPVGASKVRVYLVPHSGKYVGVEEFDCFSDTTSSTSFSASEFGLSGDVYVYDYLTDTGYKTTADANVGIGGETYKYYVITPIESSGIGLIGDKGKWVTAGKKRISSISEYNSGMTLTVQFGAFDTLTADEPAEIIGYSTVEPSVIPGINAIVTAYSYNPVNEIFQFTLEPSSSYSGEVSRDVTITMLSGDIAGLYGVDFIDFAYLADYWGLSDCGGTDDCGRADLDSSGDVGLSDLCDMAANWLGGIDE